MSCTLTSATGSPPTANAGGVPVGSSGCWWWMAIAAMMWACLHRKWQADQLPAPRKHPATGTHQRKQA